MEVEYWTNAVICRVLGANPPIQVMEGFIKRVWGKMGIDKIALVSNGVFIVRFHSFENRSKVLAEGSPMFDKKLVIVQPWSADLDVKKIDTAKVPVWVRLLDLDLKYWGQSTLMKLAGTLGRPIKTDRVTSMKELLSYARILVEMSIEEDFPKFINFKNEWGSIVHVLFKYESNVPNVVCMVISKRSGKKDNRRKYGNKGCIPTRTLRLICTEGLGRNHPLGMK